MSDLNYDLHIHSCLSPCGDDDMTPANIVGMAMIKGLINRCEQTTIHAKIVPQS